MFIFRFTTWVGHLISCTISLHWMVLRQKRRFVLLRWDFVGDCFFLLAFLRGFACYHECVNHHYVTHHLFVPNSFNVDLRSLIRDVLVNVQHHQTTDMTPHFGSTWRRPAALRIKRLRPNSCGLRPPHIPRAYRGIDAAYISALLPID